MAAELPKAPTWDEAMHALAESTANFSLMCAAHAEAVTNAMTMFGEQWQRAAAGVGPAMARILEPFAPPSSPEEAPDA